MATRYEPKELVAIIREMEGASARATINVGSSLLEYALEAALKSEFRTPESSAEKDALFSKNGCLSDFSEKIWAAYFMRVIGPETRQDLDLIRALRNSVSHDMNPVTFEMSAIADRCRSLRHPKGYQIGQAKPFDAKAVFITTIAFLCGALLTKSAHKFMGYDEWVGVQELLSILDK